MPRLRLDEGIRSMVVEKEDKGISSIGLGQRMYIRTKGTSQNLVLVGIFRGGKEFFAKFSIDCFKMTKKERT